MMPDWGKKSILGCTTTIVLLMVCEMAFRILFPKPNDIYIGDTATVWYLKPNLKHQVNKEQHSFLLQTNEFGFRGEEGSMEGGWLFLGCSTTLGWGVENGEDFVSIIGRQLGIPTHNGGQPGWSTHQAVLGLDHYPEWTFDKVFVGYGVRDAQLALQADRQSRPTPALFSLRVVQVLQRLRPTPPLKSPTIRRVSATDFRANLLRIREHFSASDVIFYPFPQIEKQISYDEVIADLGGVEAPQMGAELFFDFDQIHLNVAGHRQLSAWFVEQWTE